MSGFWKIGGWDRKSARETTEREEAVETLGKHLIWIGLDATSVTNYEALSPNIIGAYKIANQNVDFIELEWREDEKTFEVVYGDEFSMSWSNPTYVRWYRSQYRCNYLVYLDLRGLEDKPVAEGSPFKKSGFFHEPFVDFKWEGGELAQALYGDVKLKKYFLSKRQPPTVKIEPIGHHCFRIIQTRYFSYPESAFPTVAAFEACDRIAQHARDIISRQGRGETV